MISLPELPVIVSTNSDPMTPSMLVSVSDPMLALMNCDVMIERSTEIPCVEAR